MRVVSLLPSATEICYALGVEPVGVSHECDYPPAATELPSMNRVRIDTDGSSADINEAVADAESQEDGVYEIDRAALERADPELVITQGICDVCAVDTVVVEDAIAATGVDAAVLTTDVHSLDDLLADVQRIGTALDREDRAADLVGELRERVHAVADRPSTNLRDGGRRGTDSAHADRPRVAVLDWLDPVMVAGHWMPELVEIAGGRYGMAETGDRSRPREWADVREYDPEVLVAAPCGFEIDQTLANLNELTGRPGWEDISAVRDDRVVVMDGHHYVNRPGPRLVDTLEHLASVLHPERFGDPPAEVVRSLSSAAPE